MYVPFWRLVKRNELFHTFFPTQEKEEGMDYQIKVPLPIKVKKNTGWKLFQLHLFFSGIVSTASNYVSSILPQEVNILKLKIIFTQNFQWESIVQQQKCIYCF